ncbi:MAG: hypothetical protein KBD06_04125 [Candidatus Pacebacteria bacterium]|nr:hypothetical protein [Candidatus Paceibacterota bacterium]
MDTEQNAINAAVEEAILMNADAFIAADASIDLIMAWAEQELSEREHAITDAGGGVEEFKKAAAEIEAEVAKRLHALELETRQKFPETPEV